MTDAEDQDLLAQLFGVDGKVALVTGGSRGIGLMIAEGLVKAGVRVYVTARKAEACDQAAAELSRFGQCTSIPADVSSSDGVQALKHAIEERESALHLLVNNAGATWGSPIEEFPESGFDKVLDVNLKGPFLLTQAVLGLLRAAAQPDDPARVINIGSVDGLRTPTNTTFSYSSSKAGVHMLTRHLASHLACEHITVNALAPGPFDSKMMAYVLEDPQSRQAVADAVPLGRIGKPSDMAGAVIFLTSRAGSYLTGAVIPVDGGITARG